MICWLYLNKAAFKGSNPNPSLAANNIINLISVLTIWECPCVVFSHVVGRAYSQWPVCSLGKTVSLCPASFCTPRPNLPITPGISWLSTFAFQSPKMKKWCWSSGCMALEQLWGDTPRPKAEKPQQDGRRWSGGCVVLERLWGDKPCPRAKEKPKQDGRRWEIAFGIKPHTHQRCSEGSYIPYAHQDPETPQRPRQNCVWTSPEGVRVSGGLLQGQGLWVQWTWVWLCAADLSMA